MKLKVIKCYDRGFSRIRMAMGLQMRLTVAPRVSVWNCLPSGSSAAVQTCKASVWRSALVQEC